MNPLVPDLTLSDWEELRRLRIQIDVRDYQGELLVCIGTLKNVTVAVGAKVFAHFHKPDPRGDQILRNHLVYEENFTKTLEEFVIRNMYRDESLMRTPNPGLADIMDPIIPVKFLARNYLQAGTNVRALGFAMIEHYRSGVCVTLDLADTMRCIFTTRVFANVPKSPKRRGSKFSNNPAKRIASGRIPRQTQTTGEVVAIDDSEDGQLAKSTEANTSAPTSDTATEHELPYRLRSESKTRKQRLVLVNSANTDSALQPIRVSHSDSSPVKKQSDVSRRALAPAVQLHAPKTPIRQTAHQAGVSRRVIAPAKRTRAPRTPIRQTAQASMTDPFFQAVQMDAQDIATPPSSPPTASPPTNDACGMSTVLRRHVHKARFVYAAHSAFEDACERITNDGKVLAQRDRGKIGRLLEKVMGDVSAALEDL